MNNTGPRGRRGAAVALLIAPLFLALVGCDSNPTTALNRCPTSGNWSLSGGDSQLPSHCVWRGTITLSHEQSIEYTVDARHEPDIEETGRGQMFETRELEIVLTGGAANSALTGTTSGTAAIQLASVCDGGSLTINNESAFDAKVSGGGRADVTLTIAPDGSYTLGFTGPLETYTGTASGTIHIRDTCTDPPYDDRRESNEPWVNTTITGFPFTVRGQLASGADRIVGSADAPLPLIHPYDFMGRTGTLAEVYKASWTLERAR